MRKFEKTTTRQRTTIFPARDTTRHSQPAGTTGIQQYIAHRNTDDVARLAPHKDQQSHGHKNGGQPEGKRIALVAAEAGNVSTQLGCDNHGQAARIDGEIEDREV